ncbi:hypothetical protein V8J38_16815 (plasmid) [Brevundimonas olei]|uniref:Uncharacterized protein n=1 Tax=Brevundimonas olei TaxID=657642 RepID=A0ABZ2IKC5_9CAUL
MPINFVGRIFLLVGGADDLLGGLAGPIMGIFDMLITVLTIGVSAATSAALVYAVMAYRADWKSVERFRALREENISLRQRLLEAEERCLTQEQYALYEIWRSDAEYDLKRMQSKE